MIRFSINNPLITNLSLVLVMLLGVLSWHAMPQEMFPVVELDMARVTTVFEGASPEEVERQVTLSIENEFDTLTNVDIMTSTSSEGLSTVTLKLKPGTSVEQFMRDLRSRLDQITDLPEEADEPELTRLETRFPVISMSLYGNTARPWLYQTADDVKRRLLQLPGVASVGIAGDRDWEIWVEVDPQVLAARGVSLQQVITALRENMRDLPGGSLKAREGDILLRGKGVDPDPELLKQIVVRHNEAGGRLRLGDIAAVSLRLEEARTLGRFNGEPSVNLTVTKTVSASTIEVSRLVREEADRLRRELPPGVQVGLFSDLSVYVQTRLDTVKSSGLVGLVLVLLSLYLFLNFRVALITAMGIPVSFLVAVLMISSLGFTINMVSLFAFLIALGLIVDDAIIVTENIYRHMEQGLPVEQAAQIGSREVMWPVLASTSTTVAAFLPMFSIGGTLGEFIKVIPVVVAASLLGSLWEAFAVLPSHAVELLRVEKKKKTAGRIDWSALLHRYVDLLRWSLRNRYFVGLLAVGVLAVAVSYATTRLPFQLFGQADIGQFFINIEAPNTYSLEDTEVLAKRIEKAVLETVGDEELDTLLTNVGATFIDFNRFRFGSNYIQLIVDLEKPAPEGFIERFITPVVSLKFSRGGTRQRKTETIINDVRKQLQTLTGIQRLSILRPQGGPAGADIEVGVVGEDVDRLLFHARRMRDYLRQLPGVYDVRQDLDVGKLEYRYSLNERGRELGLTQQQLADAVRTGFLGLEAVQVSWEDERIPVRVIYTDLVRHNSSLENLPITLEDGRIVYLGDVADISRGRGLNTIRRRDGQRLAIVTAEVDDRETTALDVTALLEQEFAGLEQQEPGYHLLFLGEKKDAADSMRDMKRATLIAAAIIFFILASLFKSLLDPLVVMFAIPFGFIGVVVGHMLFDYHLQFLSMVGFLALTGIVVNDSLILVDFAKRLRSQGWDRMDALVEAGRVRVRPILLTSVTTFLGISPLIFFATGQTAFLSPMAVSLGFGLLFATALILVVVPCFYLMADDLRQSAAKRPGKA
ncbi:MAG TPA: efflux RND transporter permease subunit [Gammaproteobacteria bacterium]|nr:efflux RND transporter permease subunit [Gammaproteobacteria bacterium]